MPQGGLPSAKAKRVTKACDFCHTRSVRCRLVDDSTAGRCKNCMEFDQPCTFTRPSKKRGFPSGSKTHRKSDARAGVITVATPTTTDNTGTTSSETVRRVSQNTNNHHIDATTICRVIEPPKRRHRPDASSSTSGISDPKLMPQECDPPQQEVIWRLPALANQAIIVDLVEIYFEVVYPIFPLFHRPSLLRSVARGEYLTNQSLFSTVMALCALSSARERDGALFSDRWDTASLRRVAPDEYFAAAVAAIPKEIRASRDVRYLQSQALLALASLQAGNLQDMHFHLGVYHMLCQVERLHKESNWPAGIGQVEIEERRRLFWSMYTLDIYSAAVFGTIPHSREALSRVEYATEVEDDCIKDKAPGLHQMRQQSMQHTIQQPFEDVGQRSSERVVVDDFTRETHWLRGWNFTTDLYRILEHILDNSIEENSTTSFCHTRTQSAIILDKILESYSKLPQKFKTIQPITLDANEDRYSFQAANIAATIQLARMSLLNVSVEESTTQERCQVMNELLQSFSRVPSAYLSAISTPLLYHLAGIGTVLWPVVERPLTGAQYDQVRTVLIALADLLTALESGMFSVGGASQRLRSHIQRMDDHIRRQRQQLDPRFTQPRSSTHAYHPAQVQVQSSQSPEFVSGIHPSKSPLDSTRVEHGYNGLSNTSKNGTGFATSLHPPSGEVEGRTQLHGSSMLTVSDSLSPEFMFPTDMLGDWSWAFDFTQDFGEPEAQERALKQSH